MNINKTLLLLSSGLVLSTGATLAQFTFTTITNVALNPCNTLLKRGSETPDRLSLQCGNEHSHL